VLYAHVEIGISALLGTFACCDPKDIRKKHDSRTVCEFLHICRAFVRLFSPLCCCFPIKTLYILYFHIKTVKGTKMSAVSSNRLRTVDKEGLYFLKIR
jgi:hypothetical protein